ncbi:unnamed protein product, partial [Staurois parvus]
MILLCVLSQYLHAWTLNSTYLMMVRDGVTFLCGIPGIQRTGTSLWWGSHDWIHL